jgi:transposase InsO family protein
VSRPGFDGDLETRIPSLLGGRGVLELRHRLLQPDDRRLAARRAHAQRTGRRRPADGRRDPRRTRGQRADPSLRSRQPARYTSRDFNDALDDHGILASLGSTGDAYDNALAESFVDSFKTELIADRVWRSRNQLELAIVEWVGWYNQRRLHSSLGDIPPVELEAVGALQTSRAQAA